MSPEELIKLYNILFYASLAVTVLGFGLAIFFFFSFRILELRALMTGKARAETVRRIAEENARTGGLKMPVYGMSDDLDASGNIGKSGRMGKTQRTGKSERTNARVQHPTAQPTQPPITQEFYDTAVLQTAAAETSVLQSDQTAVLHRTDSAKSQANSQVSVNIRFDMTESTLVIHTDEMI